MNAPETLAEARRADRLSKRLTALESAVREAVELERLTRDLVAGLRRDGASWAVIGGVLGVSRQAAEQRYSVKKT